MQRAALGQQNKEAREKGPLCLGLNARPAGEEGFPRARDEASQACLLSPGQGPKPGFLCPPSLSLTQQRKDPPGSYLPYSPQATSSL